MCGHFADVVTDVDWKPEDGPTYPTPKRLEEMRAEEAELDRWHKRLLAADWPGPAPFRECYMCSCGPKVGGLRARRLGRTPAQADQATEA